MAALRIISAWAILLYIWTGKCKFMIMESSHRNASHITGHPWGESTGKQWTTCKWPVIVSMICEKAVDWTVELYMISDTGTLMSGYCNGAWAGHMCFVCIFAASLCAFEGIFMCIWGAFSWTFYGCFVCILVNFVTWWVSKYYITSVYDIIWLMYLRPGWQNTFPPFDTYWIHNVTDV